jgi:hypothetical protein
MMFDITTATAPYIAARQTFFMYNITFNDEPRRFAALARAFG